MNGLNKNLFILGLLLLLSCKGEESNPEPTGALIISEDSYSANMNESFSINIQLAGNDQIPIAGEEITVSILAGDIITSTTTLTTTNEGQAEVNLELKESYSNSIRVYFSGNENYHSALKNIEIIGKYTYRQPDSSNGLVSENLLESGVSTDLIFRMVDSIRRNNTKYQYLNSVLLQQNGKLLLEEYFPYEELVFSGVQRTNGTHYIASVSKSITSASIGIALEMGLINSLDDKVLDYFPDNEIQNLDDRKKSMTIRNLLHMQSGLNCNDSGSWEAVSNDYIDYHLNLAMSTNPGTNFNYCTGVTMLLGAIIEKASGSNPQDFANEHLLEPLGIAPGDSEWGRDPSGNVMVGYNLWMKARDMIKFGQLYLDNGIWNGEQVVPASWVAASVVTGPSLTFANRVIYGYQWWVGDHSVNGKTYRAYYAVGNGGSYIINIPELNAVIVFQGAQWNSGSVHTTVEVEFMDQLIIPALLAAID